MSRSRRNHRAAMAASSAGRRVRRAAQVKLAAAQMKPFAERTGAAAKRRVRRTGQVLQHSIAPTVSAWLSAAARRLEPAKPQRSRWRKLAGFSMLAAAAGAAAALVRNRKKPDSATPAAATDAGNVAPGTATSDGQAMASAGADADGDGQVRTS